ncbi:MAG: hypothetical protein LBB47_02795 [Spirochaetaceae bacterium]|nr:hypothetical protein [Spirochaetaceae bacterium]
MRNKFLSLSIYFFMVFFTIVCISSCEILAPKQSASGSSEGSNQNNTNDNQTPQQPPNSSQPSQTPGIQNLVWYVSDSGKDSNAGTDASTPLASVQTALSRIKTAYKGGNWPTGESATIVISGTIRASGSFDSSKAMINVAGAGSYPPIILKGDPNQKGVLDANRNSSDDGRVLYIANNKVTLEDDLTLTGGYTLWGGGVLVGLPGTPPTDGEFVMAGGEISGNSGGLGGGVMVYKGSMTMTGGDIKNNVNDEFSGVPGSGGGVYLYENNAFTMFGGNISGNGGAKTDKGGGVLIDGKAHFTLAGGKILNNNSFTEGGGLQVLPLGEFTMSGGTIKGNTSAKDGGVSVSPYGATFTKTGGNISENTPN